MKNLYLILLIVVIVGIVAIFALTFLTAGNQNLTGAAAWIGGKSCDCGGNADCRECCQPGCNTQNKCDACGGTWAESAA
jgi:hypothetical protein